MSGVSIMSKHWLLITILLVLYCINITNSDDERGLTIIPETDAVDDNPSESGNTNPDIVDVHTTDDNNNVCNQLMICHFENVH